MRTSNLICIRSCLKAESNEREGLGVIKGVLAPVTLSMFSSILFLRIGYIVGNAGFLQTTAIFLISYTLLGFTVLSICALATNGAVRGGGVYFMLSRTMGPEFGGSIGEKSDQKYFLPTVSLPGFLFYLANIAGSALNVVACTEGVLSNFGPQGALVHVLPEGHWWQVQRALLLTHLSLLSRSSTPRGSTF